MNNDIRKKIIEIMFVIVFLLSSTLFIYMPRSSNMASALTFLNGVKNFYMEDLTSGVLLKDANPMKDDEGLQLSPYRFQVINKSNRNITYKIIFKNTITDESMRLKNKYLRYSISTDTNNSTIINTIPDDDILLITTIAPNSREIFNFRMWLDWNCDNLAFGKMFSGVIQIEEVE